MAGIWDTLPASPCSAASDDATTRTASKPSSDPVTKHQVLLNTLPATPTLSLNMSSSSEAPTSTPHSPGSPPVAKRARIDISNRSTQPVALDLDKPASPETVADLPSSLAEDDLLEKRRQLLERLQIIKNKKASLAKSPSPEDEVTVVEEKLAPSSRQAQSRRPSGKKSSKATVPAADDIIDVDNTPVPKPAPKRKTGKRKHASSVARATPMKTIDVDLEAAKRKSSRVRRPRTPNLLDDKESKVGPMPTCMSKCKRLQFCKKLTMSMLKDENAKPFSAPVKELWHEQAIPRYFDIITHPMDLGTIKKNLDTTRYIRPVKGDSLPYRFDVEHFADDVRLVFRNAMVYNRAGDFIHNCAHSLLEAFEKSLDEVPPLALGRVETPAASSNSLAVPRSVPKKKSSQPRASSDGKEVLCGTSKGYRPRKISETRGRKSSKPNRKGTEEGAPRADADLEGMSVRELRDRLRYLQKARVPVLARSPVPKGAGYLSKAALLYPIEMSWTERKKCSECIGRVPGNKTELLIDLLKKSCNVPVTVSADGMEFEFDKLDNKSMRNLEAFLEQNVAGFKTVRSSVVGREFPDVEVVDSETQRVRSRLDELMAEKKRRSSASKSADGNGRSETDGSSKSKSFFDEGNAHESSSDSSDSDSSSDESDSSSDDDSGDESE